MSYFITQFLVSFLIIHLDSDLILIEIFTFLLISLIIGVLIYSLGKLLEILLTSSIGSYSIIRGCGLMLGGFPDEEYVSALLKYREMYQLKMLFIEESIFYTIFLILIFAISICIQFYTFEDEKKDDKRYEKRRSKKSTRN